MTHKQQRDVIVAQAMHVFTTTRNELFAEHRKNKHKSCLLWSCLLVRVLRRHRLRGVLQAGTSRWRVESIKDAEATGHNAPACFSYTFNLDEAVPYLLQGKLPEMHVWVALPDHEEIIDITSSFQEQQFRELASNMVDGVRVDWKPHAKLPLYIWGAPSELDEKGWHYEPHIQATQLAYLLDKKFTGDIPA